MEVERYTWLVSTFRPVELGRVESNILSLFLENPSNSTYNIYKKYKEYSVGISGDTGYPKPLAYKNIHKRVKRLAQLKLIEPIEGHFDRGAKYYRASPYGLITYVGSVITESSSYIYYNTDNLVIQSLLLQSFEEGTISSFRSLKEFPTADIGEYLHECCLTTISICKRFWTKYSQYNLKNALPSDDIIQRYMAYIDGESVDRYVLDKIEEYRKGLPPHLQYPNSNDYFYKNAHPPRKNKYNYKESPLPLLDIHFNIVVQLEITFEIKAKTLAFNLVSQLGEIVTSGELIKNKEELEEGLLESGRDYSLYNILNDKKFIELVRKIRRDFEYGYKQFLYYQ
jgi:hypothetical protein